MVRTLTPEEYVVFQREAAENACWQALAQFASSVYGPHAHTLAVTTFEPQWDGQVVIRGVTVSNADGVELQPDLTTRWWKPRAAAHAGRWDDEWIQDILSETMAMLPATEDMTISVNDAPPRTIQIGANV